MGNLKKKLPLFPPSPPFVPPSVPTAGLLKQFIRELPAPLLTFEYLEAFVQVDGKNSSIPPSLSLPSSFPPPPPPLPAGLLKQFIRELPAPLLTFEYLEAFIQVRVRVAHNKFPRKVQYCQKYSLSFSYEK